MTKRPPTAAVKRYWEWIPDRCSLCQQPGTAIHHILARAPGKNGRRDNMLVARLCHFHHNLGTESVHLLGSEAAFLRVHDVDLVAIAVLNRDAWEKRNA